LVQLGTSGGQQQEDEVARQLDDGPALPLYLTEPGRAVGDYGLYLAALPLISRLPRGDGHPVLVLPGLLADDISTRTLRAVLRRLGYDAQGWGLGRNIGPTAACVNGTRDLLTHLSDKHQRPVSLIGWSLFRLARNSQSRATKVFDRFSHLHVEHRTLPLESESIPLTVPATSIYSHYDGIVHWQTCLNTPGERCENIAVMASHLGLGHHPASIWAVADRLGQREGAWTPFRAPRFLRPAFPKPAEPEAADPVAAHGTAA
jgi:hypothetical protein